MKPWRVCDSKQILVLPFCETVIAHMINIVLKERIVFIFNLSHTDVLQITLMDIISPFFQHIFLNKCFFVFSEK